LANPYISEHLLTYGRSTERQVFCFSHLDKPPYMITGTLPQRLARIRHIHLHYQESKCHVPPTGFNPNWTVDRKCSTCNFCHWLEAVTKSMTGLRTVKISLYLPGKYCPCPTLNHAWVVRLLELQQRSKAAIEVALFPNLEKHDAPLLPALLWRTHAFKLQLQKELTRLRESKTAAIKVSDTWSIARQFLPFLQRVPSVSCAC